MAFHLVLYVQHEYGFYCFKARVSFFFFIMTSQRKENKSYACSESPARDKMMSSNLANRGFGWLVLNSLKTLFSMSILCKKEKKWNKVVEMVLLDYLCRTVRQAPSRCIFAGNRKSLHCRSCYKYDHRQLITMLFLTLSNPHSCGAWMCIRSKQGEATGVKKNKGIRSVTVAPLAVHGMKTAGRPTVH